MTFERGLAVIEKNDTETKGFYIDQDALEFARMNAKLDKQRKELEKARKNLAGLEAKLSNENFTARAPEAVVNAEKEKAEKAKALIAQLEASEASMKNL